MKYSCFGVKERKSTANLILPMIIGCMSVQAYASDDNNIKSAAEAEVEKYSTLGTRGFFRSVTESTVTLDIIEQDVLRQQGETDMMSILSNVLPSFNVQDHPNINDASSLLHPANLRGLSSDSFLVLVNGKRRHRSAIINFLGGGLSDGAQGVDLTLIPVSALKQVEVLRSGASAQYGSDAIAGVLNFALKDNAKGGSVELRTGQYGAGDGDIWQFAGNLGLPLTAKGFINLSYEYKHAEPTSRSVLRDDVAELIAAGNTAVEHYAQTFGDPHSKYEHKFFFNAGVDLADEDKVYTFGNIADREIDQSGFFFRNPNNRSGVFTEMDGNRLVAALGENTCPLVTSSTNPNDPELLALMDNPNCFVFNEVYPGGFTPTFAGRIKDASLVLGLKGSVFEDIYFDVSASFGQSIVNFYLANSLNPSYGPFSPTNFDIGAYKQREQQLNIDASKEIAVSHFSAPINLAWGLEYKHEGFEIEAGEQASWQDGGFSNQGFSIGANGFPGFQDSDAGEWSRDVVGVYTDAEFYITDDITLLTALRFEDYSDFGNTLTGKVAGRIQLTDSTALRAAISTGYRAPTVGQTNVRNVTSTFGPNGLEDVITLPATHPVSAQVGATPLDAEKSLNTNIGLVTTFDNGLFLTVDYFKIAVSDRISQTSIQRLSAQDIESLTAANVDYDHRYAGVKYFTNDFDTTTQGIDVTAKYNYLMFGGNNQFTFAYNWTDTELDSYTPSIINQIKVSNLENNLPHHRLIVSNRYRKANWQVLVKARYYGSYVEYHLRRDDQRIDAGGELVFDAEVSYQLSEQVSLSVGAHNLFDNAPDANPYASANGAEYPVTSPMGINGSFYYIRGEFRF